MKEVTHILVFPVENKDTGVRNVIHFYGVEQLKNYIAGNPDILKVGSVSFYKVDEIKPTRTVTIDVSL